MGRYSTKRADHWDIAFWLVFSRYGEVRLTRGDPALSSDERAMSISMKVPHSLFRVAQLRGTITLGEAGGPPPTIDITAAETALTEALGAVVELTIKEPTE